MSWEKSDEKIWIASEIAPSTHVARGSLPTLFLHRHLNARFDHCIVLCANLRNSQRRERGKNFKFEDFCSLNIFKFETATSNNTIIYLLSFTFHLDFFYPSLSCTHTTVRCARLNWAKFQLASMQKMTSFSYSLHLCGHNGMLEVTIGWVYHSFFDNGSCCL